MTAARRDVGCLTRVFKTGRKPPPLLKGGETPAAAVRLCRQLACCARPCSGLRQAPRPTAFQAVSSTAGKRHEAERSGWSRGPNAIHLRLPRTRRHQSQPSALPTNYTHCQVGEPPFTTFHPGSPARLPDARIRSSQCRAHVTRRARPRRPRRRGAPTPPTSCRCRRAGYICMTTSSPRMRTRCRRSSRRSGR